MTALLSFVGTSVHYMVIIAGFLHKPRNYSLEQAAVTRAICVLTIQLFRISLSYPNFRSRIPNGYNVPHPCDTTTPEWRGVGHTNRNGGGERNPFGLAFASSNFVWTSLLCRADSDGDGLTNGQELGDPDCKWAPGFEPARRPQSHPGVCEPLDSPTCNGKNYFLYCEEKEFTCAALQNQDTVNMTVELPLTSLTESSSVHMCMDFEFPYDTERHIVATRPLIHHPDLVHSIHVYSRLVVRKTRPLDEPYWCSTDDLFLEGLISVWQRGLSGECHHDNMGMQVGGEFGHRYATMQIQYINPEVLRGRTDNSGLVFYLTAALRAQHAGYFQLGPRYLQIPASTPAHRVTARLEPACSRMILQEVYISVVLGQMYNLGRNITVTLSRNGKVINYLTAQNHYDHHNVRAHRFIEPLKVQPGDELSVTCSYDSTTKDVTTFWGDGVEDEKCQVVIGYYPQENIRVPRAFTYGSMSYCDYLRGEYRGCDLHMLTNPERQEGKNIKHTVSRRCRPGLCLPECFEYVKNLKQTACFYGDANTLLRHPFNMEKEQELLHVRLYAAIDSCDTQIAHEQCELVKFRNHANRHVTHANSLIISLAVIGLLTTYTL